MSPDKTVAVNRKARFDYEIMETFEAGLALTGMEIKAIREGQVNLSDAYARPEGGELWLHNVHIPRYSAAHAREHDPTRPRRLLMHKSQIRELTRQVSEKGLTLIPLKLYLKRHLAKVELGVARGRKRYDKRQAIIEKDRLRQAQEAFKSAR